MFGLDNDMELPQPPDEPKSEATFAASDGYMPWLNKLKYIATESGLRHIVPKDDSKMLQAYESGWSPEMALDDLMWQNQFGI